MEDRKEFYIVTAFYESKTKKGCLKKKFSTIEDCHDWVASHPERAIYFGRERRTYPFTRYVIEHFETVEEITV